ncbi:SufE family protein [Flavobacterium sp. Sd200]|uniref:SufE family protein n=1 Tax=Flavobacterium sp. Sd200 TaxID=2692211 RepID=UPI001367B655|nr:SufE family protein [Flavobacterium sp. Sd200]MXN91707.1 SufE family protein [Flavobacterium sp. Sd200]
MSIPEKQQKIINDFSLFEDWNDTYEHIINVGRLLNNYPDSHKIENNLIRGCQSKVWLRAEFVDGKILYSADSDTAIIKGIIAILLEVFSDNLPEDIIAADTHFIKEIGLKDFLAPTRANGLVAMINQIKEYASMYKDNNVV